jgi:hypothetical protein
MRLERDVGFFGFLRLFVLQDTVTFLIEDLVTLGASAESSVSCTESLSGITACGGGAAVALGCGSSSSLQTGNRFYTTRKKEVKKTMELTGTLTNP